MQGMGPQAPPLMPPSLDLDMNIYSRHFPDPNNMVPVPMLPAAEPSHFAVENGLLLEEEKSLAMELAMSSVNELVKMCQSGQPLWMRKGENGREVLNVEEHARMFPWPLNELNQNEASEFSTEATRDSAVVIMNSITFVDAFLDAVSFSIIFYMSIFLFYRFFIILNGPHQIKTRGNQSI